MVTVCRLTNKLARCFLAECLGTFLLILIGNGAVAQSVLSHGANGDYFTINAAWGMGVTLALYVAAGVSDGHINPAVTIAVALRRKFPWRSVPIYIVAQYLGAICASAIIYIIYKDGFDEFDGGLRQVTGPNSTAGVFATYPKEFVSTSSAFVDQVVGTGILLLCVAAISDDRNMKPNKGSIPIAIGSVVFAIGISFGFNCGYAINPARDLGPRIFTSIAGWGKEVFSFRNYNWFWVPVIGPHLGAILGIVLYDFAVDIHWQPSEHLSNKLEIVELAELSKV